MPTSTSSAMWRGNLKEGNGTMSVGPGHYEGPYTYASRFESGKGTNPEELIGAAHAGCFSMFLSGVLTRNGFEPNEINTTANVHLVPGTGITKIELNVEASVPNVSDEQFADFAQQAKDGCPVSKALASVGEITVNAQLVSS
jgi:lipoyl-dependent peroxiredoxin